MTNEMEEYQRLLRSDVPPSHEEARERALLASLAAFDKEKLSPRQGSPLRDRLMEALRHFHNTLLGGDTMKTSRIIAGGLTIGLAVLLLSTSNLQTLKNQIGASPTTDGAAPLAQTSVSGSTHPEKAKQLMKVEEVARNMAAMPSLTSAPTGMVQLADKKGDLQRAIPEKKAMPMAAASVMPLSPPPALREKESLLGGSFPAETDAVAPSYQEEGRDKFEHVKANSLHVTKEEPVSTFSIDVDTSSYSFLRAALNGNVLPQKDAIRIEELVNYFPYEYEVPENREAPFKANVAVLPTPWNHKTKLIHIGIKGYQMEQKEKPHANLVFLIDTSGSMNAPNKLPLVKNALALLLDSLAPEDTVGIVTYAGNAGIALEPTPAKEKSRILSVLTNLQSWGSTAGAEGVRQAYQLAEQHLDKHGVNRVILATDGDFNVGITNQNELKSFVERERDTGISLSVLGFGRGNYNDALMQALAQNGNGNAAYIDNLNEARKVLVDEANSTLFTIAKDVKIQVEFNPARVAEYRLIGYETRLLNREDFNNDKVDAGEIGAGHAVTALYEITPTESDAKLVDDLRYPPHPAEEKEKASSPGSDEYAFVKIRYKLPSGDTSKLISTPVDSKVESKELASAPQEARFATAVAAFGQLMRGDAFMKDFTYEDVISLAQGAKGSDNFGYRAEFINLVRLASHAPKLPAPQGGVVIPPPPVPMPAMPTPIE